MRAWLSRTSAQALLIGLLSTLLLALVEWMLTRSGDLIAGYRFHAWSSEEFMQEVRINDLLAVGPIGLWYLHVQPPMLETMRFLLSLPEYLSGGRMTAQMIDQRMYGLYAVLYGVLNAVVYAWIATLTRSRRWALAGTILFALYPGTLAIATLLDGTFPSSVFVTGMLFLLFLTIRTRSATLLNWWLASLLLVSLTRTIFQLQVLIFVPVVVWLLYRTRIGARSTTAIVLSVVLTGSLFLLPAKQYALYRTTATTSFAGNHQIEVVSYRPTDAELDAVEVPPEILDTAARFVSGYNSPENIRLNYVLTQVGNDYYRENPFQVAKNLIWGFQMNTAQAFKFTHEYSSTGPQQPNRLAAAMPWTPPMVNGISVTFYLLVLLATFLALLYAFTWRGLLRRAWRYWPLLFVVGMTMLTFLLANRYDWSEADRLKFIVEPFFAVTFFASLAFAVRTFRDRRSRARHVPRIDSRPS